MMRKRMSHAMIGHEGKAGVPVIKVLSQKYMVKKFVREGTEMEIVISSRDREILRELAKKQLELANAEINQRRKKLWYKHNALQGEVPLVHLDAWGLYHELVDPKLKCEGEFARLVEREIYKNFINQDWFDDDRVTPDKFGWNYDTGFKAFDMDIKQEFVTGKKENEDSGLGMHFIPVLEDLEEEFDDLKPSTFWVDEETSQKKVQTIQEAFGDILPVYMKMDCLYAVPTQQIVHLMGMENMMLNLAQCPDKYKEMMDRLADDFVAYYRMLEEKRMILPTAEYEWVGQATFAYTDELPNSREVDGRPLTTKDVWGFMDSQETLCISPKMFEELIFPCYEKIGKQFGILSYGCCEPVDRVWESCVSKFDNLRKVSISPWADEDYMGEVLRGSRVIYHRKPSPNYLGVGDVLDEEAVRKHIRKSLVAARGCKMEITQRDVYTLNHDPGKGRRFVELIREEIENNWKA